MERDPLDEEFIQLMLDVENGYSEMTKHEKVRIEQWSKKLCQVTTNALWKKNRNKYASLLYQQVKEGKLVEPFVKVPPEGPIPQFQSHNFARTQPKKPMKKPMEEFTKSPSVEYTKKPLEDYIKTGDYTKKNSAEHVKKPIVTYGKRPVPEQSKKSFGDSFKKSVDEYSRGNLEDYSRKSIEEQSYGDSRLEKLKSESKAKSFTNNSFERPSVISRHTDHDDIVKLKMQLEIAHVNEKHLREELSKRTETVNQQRELIEKLQEENNRLRARQETKEEVVTQSSDPKTLLSLDEISSNLKRLERLQQSLYKS